MSESAGEASVRSVSLGRRIINKIGPIIDSEWNTGRKRDDTNKISGPGSNGDPNTGGKSQKASDPWTKVADKVAPPLILALIAYGIYAYCFKYAWQYVGTRHGQGRSIVLITIFAVLLFLMLFCWGMVLVVGAGRVDAPDPNVIPEVFMCDPWGHRQWCSTCQAIKPDRAHHSGLLGRCIPNMDHYCSWLAAVIGAGNVKYFVQFLMYVDILMLYVIVTLLIYAHKSPLPNNVSVMYAIAAFLLFLLGGFLGQHARYIIMSMTTLEHMDLRRGNHPIFSIDFDGQRIVTRLRAEDLALSGPYSEGYYRNWCNTMGRTPLHWFLPLPVPMADNVFNQKLLETLRERFRSGEEGYVAQFQPGQEGGVLGPSSQPPQTQAPLQRSVQPETEQGV